MIYLSLFLVFFKIGLFSFGGGYAMIPLIQTEMESAGWLGAQEFADVVSISQMTPGPIGVNVATYAGFRTAGVPGSICATFGVFLPSLIIVIAVAHFMNKFKNNAVVDAVFKGIRPATIGLIAAAVLFFAQISIFNAPLGLENLGRIVFKKAVDHPVSFSFDYKSVLIFTAVLIGITKLKLAPIPAVFIAALLGIVIY